MDANCVQKGREPNLGRDIAIKAALFTRRCTPTYAIASVLKLNHLVLSTTITSFTAVVDDKYLNPWLNWKFQSKRLKLSGYSRSEQLVPRYNQQLEAGDCYIVTNGRFLL